MEELLAYICDEICGKRRFCLTQEKADEICERCDIDDKVAKVMKAAYTKGKIDGLKKASEIAERTILKPDVE